MTQREKVIARLQDRGQVDNFWAIGHNILRLGAIMCQLKKEGWHFSGAFGEQLKKGPKNRKNYYYLLNGQLSL